MARKRKLQEQSEQVFQKRRMWHIAIYIRLSKDDGNDESLSVTNQKKITLDYLEHFFEEEYEVVHFYMDDGMTGTDYERPAFQRMLQDIETNKVDCILCKNLSRAFRNYSDQGYFLENYFPLHRIRFITIGDPKVDSFLHPETIQNLEVPITGLMNDRYACKTSNDVRKTFDTKRRNGEFIGAFAPYGYSKDPQNKNHLIPDREAACIVQDIYRWFLQDGFSKAGIARRLNERGIPNPTLYKYRVGTSGYCPYANGNDGLWSATTVSRILQNQVYIGNMVQGKQQVISYKVHDRIAVPQEQWYIKENTHEPVIDPSIFCRAQKMQQRDMRTAPQQGKFHLFSGLLRCGDCKKALTRKTAKDIVYYACRTYAEKSKRSCTKHSIREDVLKQAVLVALQKQIELIGSISEVMASAERTSLVHPPSSRLSHFLKLHSEEDDKLQNTMEALYMDWKNGDITRDEYHRMKTKLGEQRIQLQKIIQNLQQELKNGVQSAKADQPLFKEFTTNQNIVRLERGMLVELVDRIDVYEGGRIKITFHFVDPYQRMTGI